MKRSHVIAALSAAALSYSIVPTYAYKLRNRLHHTNTDQTLFLTFDDGPDSHYTPELLDLLEQYHIKASFFVVAQFAQQNPELLYRMQRSGHVIGLHSLCHKNGMLQPPLAAYYDFKQALQIMHHLGVPIHYFRPPWGHWNIVSAAMVHRHGLKPMMWDVMAEDWEGDTTATEIANKLLSRAHSGDIICVHDGRGRNDAPSRTIAALRRVIPIWLSCGYRFETVNAHGE